MCNDIDECLEGFHNCSNETEICINTFGSFECQCITGYMKDNGVCNDINECDVLNGGCSHYCNNTDGSYYCSCPVGYELVDQELCKDINECDVLNGGCSHYCNNTDGSYYCSCPVGYDLVNELLCEDIDECSNSSLNDCDDICINTFGSFLCQCRDGYELVNNSCIPQQCIEILTSPSNGILECNSSVQVTHTRCNTRCDIGYEVVGSAVRICQPDGIWSGESAYCQPLRCPTLFPPINGYVQLPCTPLYDSECFVRCFDGFELVNGNGSVYCDLDENDEEMVQWTEYGVCNRTPACVNNPCKHGGICSEAGDNEFTCDCTGTLYQGLTCEQGLVIITEISVLTVFQPSMVNLLARPDEELIVDFVDTCQTVSISKGIAPNGCNKIKFDKSQTMRQILIFPLSPGFFELKIGLSGNNSMDYVQPQSIPVVVVSQGQDSPYFRTFGDSTIRVTRSCCSSTTSPLICKPSIRSIPIVFQSSCNWTSTTDSLSTGGIVFSSFNRFYLPISVAGLSISENSLSLSDANCGSCPGLTPLNQITVSNSQDQVCYSHQPTTSDVSEFVSKQSLETTFISTIQDSLLLTWLRLSVPSDDGRQTLEQADLLIDIIEDEDLINNLFCPRMIIDSTGYFALLLHNGLLKVELQSSMNSYETQAFISPPRGSYYCIGVNLCLDRSSPVYIGIPPSAQSAIQNISFISEYVNKGWDLTFLSTIIRNLNAQTAGMVSKINYWNGVTPDYNPPFPRADISVNMEASGRLEYGDTSVGVKFGGIYLYQYTTEMNEETIAIADGDHTVTIKTKIFGELKSLELEEISNSAFIYHQENIPSCTTENAPGIAWKLTYKPQPSQDFYLNLLSLPFDTPNCPVDVFLNLDSNKDMNGVSFYSTCLIIRYDELLFVDLIHTFYIPLDNETLCTSVNLTNQFPDYQSFGLLIHSTLPPTQSMGIPLGSFFKLLSGSDNIAVSFGFSSSSDSKMGLLHSVDITVLGTTFNSQLVLQDSELSFMGSANIFGDVIYFAHMMGRGDTLSTWDDPDINIIGWFPQENASATIQTKLEDSVHIYLEQIASSARDRLDEAEQQHEQALRRFNNTEKELERNLQLYRNVSWKYNQTVQQQHNTEISLMLAQNALENATGQEQLTESIRLWNKAQQNLMLAQNQVIRVGLSRDIVERNLEAIQLAFSTAEALKTIAENKYQSVIDSIIQGLEAYELMNSQNLNLHEIFNIINITFNVNLGIQTPVVFPIDVHFESSQFNEVSVISLLYNFQRSFDTQKDSLNEDIINILFGCEQNLDDTTCNDVKNCDVLNRGCSHYCNNIDGSYFCSCPLGYQLKDAYTCEDINECNVLNGGCSHYCNNTDRSYYCSCPVGYELIGQQLCKDIDECLEGLHNCFNENEICINTFGSFECQCITGYMKENGVCNDINECDVLNGGCSHYCNNTNGDYYCSCPVGYELVNELLCEDIDECSNSFLNDCDDICINTFGSFMCQCRDGYELVNNSCIAQQCIEVLSSPSNGVLECNSSVQVTHTRCNTICDIGYEVVGSAVRICQPDGTWSGETAYCQPLRCPTLFPPINGYVQLPCTPLYDSECFVRCFDGFELVNGNNSVRCNLDENDEEMVQWTEYGVCNRTHNCGNNPCKHGGICSETSDNEFTCDCTGTLYQGLTCEQGLVIITEISILTVFQISMVNILARPDEELIVDFKDTCIAIGAGQGIMPNNCNQITFTRTHTMKQIPILPLSSGFFELKIGLSGINSRDYVQPQSIPVVVVSQGQDSPYFRTFGDSITHLTRSCCSRNSSELKCEAKSIGFHSSCDWTSTADSLSTGGIVFSSFNRFYLPISVAGLSISENSLSLSDADCGSCPGLTPMSEITFSNSQDQVCYSHKPTASDIAEFVSKQSLETTFIFTIQDSLLPTWLRLSVPSDVGSQTLEQADLLIDIIEDEDLINNLFCPRMIIDSTGYFALLLHNGALKVEVQSSMNSYETQAFISPPSGSYYCIGVNLCLDGSSPVYIGIPPSAQSAIQNISFISEYVNKGWNLTFLSTIIRNLSDQTAGMVSKIDYWNGITPDYNPPLPRADISVNMKASGQFEHGDVSVTIEFLGNITYQYTTEMNKETIVNAHGQHTVTITTKLFGEKQTLVLLETLTSTIIYHTQNIPHCTRENTPGIAWKLAYKPQPSQDFYLNLLSLPFDTPNCSVNVFLNLDSNKDMNGLSFYSTCLIIKYDELLFVDLTHKFYIPLENETLCTSVNLTNEFPDYHSFGLLIHSTLPPTQSMGIPLGSFFKLLPGSDSTAVSFGFSSSSDSKVGLLHSVDITLLNATFNSQLVLQDSELSFMGSADIFGDVIYFAHMMGRGDSSSRWDDLDISIIGWFPQETRKFLYNLKDSVHAYLLQIANSAKDRSDKAKHQLQQALRRFNNTKKELERNLQLYRNVSREYNQTVQQQEDTETSLMLAQNALENATGQEQLTASIRFWNKAQQNLMLAQNQVIRVGLSRDIVERNLKAIQLAFSTAEALKTSAENNYQSVNDSISQGLEAYELMNSQNLTLHEIFNITNITFNVNVGIQTPVVFPIDVHFESSQFNEVSVISLLYNFQTSFDTQKDTLNEDIITALFPNNDIAERKKRFAEKKQKQHEEFDLIGQEQVEIRDYTAVCPAEGQIFKPCISSCQYTCESFGRQIQCSDDCTAGCDCPDGLILDEMDNQCVMPSECPCPACDPLPNNCTNIVQPSGEERCGCPQCRDCPIEGQVYQDCQTCSLTCTQLDKICSTQCIPGCGCPEGQIIDEQNNKCILLRDCPTCPPTCTPGFCVANRRSICTIPQSVTDIDCPGGCVISNCQACYYSYIPLPFPMLDPSCPSFCIKDGNIDEECLNSWGRCVQRGYSRTYPRLPSSARIPENYNCWSHPCSQD